MWAPTSGAEAGHMIIDPQSFAPLEMSRHLAAAEAAFAVRRRIDEVRPPRPSRRRHRGLLLRAVAWATGRTVHA